MQTSLDWTEGSFEASLFGFGKHLWPEAVPAPDHEHIPFEVSPCHRALSLGLAYEPAEAGVLVEEDDIEIEAAYSFRFQAGLIAPDGTLLHRIEVDDPTLGTPFGVVEEPGEYVLELELLDGAAVEWETRVRGFAILDDPTCDLWLNEVQLNPPTTDLGGEQWVEVYNANDEAFDLSQWRITGENSGDTSIIEDGTAVPGEGHLQILLDEGFFKTQGEIVQLKPPVGNVLDASPSLTDSRPSDSSHQRCPDGSLSWGFAVQTPGEPNPDHCDENVTAS